MLGIDKKNDTFLYRQVFDLIAENIESGTLLPGDKLPSLRRMSRTAGVSIPTVRQAYIELERQRRVESRPQSGFYVRHRAANEMIRPTSTAHTAPAAIRYRTLMERVYDSINEPDLVPLGIANPCMARPAAKALHRTMKRIMASAEERSLSYARTNGEPGLRRQIAYHYLDTIGAQVEPDQICITNGGQEALLLALKAVAKPGDIIAVETPTYHGLLELIDRLGMLAVAVETCPEDGVQLDDLQRLLGEHEIRACLFCTTLSNPLGVTMSEANRRQLTHLLHKHGVALIEDDVYGELRFDGERPVPAQFLGQARAFTCGSFSKTAAPGYRIGWVIAQSADIDEVIRLKRAFSCTSGLLQQITLSEFLASGDYSRHIKLLRPELQRNAERMSALVAKFFPEQTRTSRPVGGSVLWLELPASVNTEQLFDEAIDAGISVAPGHIFSTNDYYTHFLRLGFGHPWNDRTGDAIQWLGKRTQQLSRTDN